MSSLYGLSESSATVVIDNGKAPATLRTSGGRGRNPQGGPDMSTLTELDEERRTGT